MRKLRIENLDSRLSRGLRRVAATREPKTEIRRSLTAFMKYAEGKRWVIGMYLLKLLPREDSGE
jgi:hypothetical protein